MGPNNLSDINKSMNRTLAALTDSVPEGSANRAELLRNLDSKESREEVLNLVQLYFDFENSIVTVKYYVKDRRYPDQILSFDEFRDLLS